jgi:hypothetical protein
MKYWIGFFIFAVPLNVVAWQQHSVSWPVAILEGIFIGLISGVASHVLEEFL